MRAWTLPSSTEGPRFDPVGRLNGWLRRVPAWPAYLLGAIPFALILWQTVSGNLGVDPVKEIEHELGDWALKFLVAVLAVSPLRRVLGLNLLKFRRAIGLLAFFYTALHLMAWLVLDMGLLLGQALGDIVKRPYITIGMAALLMMLPLALSSNDWSVRRLGAARWQRLHRLTYPAAVLGALHYIWLVKAWPLEPMLYMAAILALLALRFLPGRRAKKPASRATAAR